MTCHTYTVGIKFNLDPLFLPSTGNHKGDVVYDDVTGDVQRLGTGAGSDHKLLLAAVFGGELHIRWSPKDEPPRPYPQLMT